MKVVHYLNQFFGGIGGEEHAGSPPEVREGATGPGRLLDQLLGPEANVVQTLVCGDNYAAENLPELTDWVLSRVKEAEADLFFAGPCFEAGRYGVAAAAICVAVQEQLGIPVVTAMAEENPGVDLYRRDLYIVDSGQNVAAMRDVIGRMVALSGKLLRKEEIGPPSEEGYLSRGLLQDGFVPETAAERLVSMLYAKVSGQPFQSEFKGATFQPVAAPPRIIDLSRARVAIVTDGGVVPKGNPDRIAGNAPTNWGSYDISSADDLRGEDYEVTHGGYDKRYVEQDPDRMVPVDMMRRLEQAGVIGKLHERFISTSGLANPIANSRRLGREIAERLKEEEVDAVILVSA
jgi:glycine reductase complex component B subunit gamma